MKGNKYLFTDLRHIDCGQVDWHTDQGEAYGVARPPGAEQTMHASVRSVPFGVRLAAQKASKTPPFQAWTGWGRVVYDSGIYRSWCLEADGEPLSGTGSHAHEDKVETLDVCAMESKDGYEWHRTTRCPIQAAHLSRFDGQTFFIDPVAPANERYKIVFMAEGEGDAVDSVYREYMNQPERYIDSRLVNMNRKYCLFTAISPDGESWQMVNKPIMMHMADTDTTIYHDDEINKYVLYTRLFRQSRRWVGRAETEDFNHWPQVEPIIWPRLDEPWDQDIYLNAFSRYPGLPAYRFMFPMFYHRRTERSHVMMHSSEDGVAWHQVPGGPVLEPGPTGSWDSEFISAGKDLVPLDSDKIAIPYHGTPYPHKYPRWPSVYEAWKGSWAWWPKDRICSVKADGEGEFRTSPLDMSGETLRLNYRTVKGGEILVELKGRDGYSIAECDPMSGDETNRLVTWKGDPRMRLGDKRRPMIRFRMRGAEIFALDCGD